MTRILPRPCPGIEVGDVGAARKICVLLQSGRGLVVKSFVRHRVSTPRFDGAVDADVKDIGPTFQDEDAGPAEDHCSAAVRKCADGDLGMRNIWRNAQLLQGHRDADEQPAVVERAVQKPPHPAPALRVVGKGFDQRLVDPFHDGSWNCPVHEGQVQALGNGGSDEAAPRAVSGGDGNRGHAGYGPPFAPTGSGSDNRYPLTGTRPRTRSICP